MQARKALGTLISELKLLILCQPAFSKWKLAHLRSSSSGDSFIRSSRFSPSRSKAASAGRKMLVRGRKDFKMQSCMPELELQQHFGVEGGDKTNYWLSQNNTGISGVFLSWLLHIKEHKWCRKLNHRESLSRPRHHKATHSSACQGLSQDASWLTDVCLASSPRLTHVNRMAQPTRLNLLHSYKQAGEHSTWHMPWWTWRQVPRFQWREGEGRGSD